MNKQNSHSHYLEMQGWKIRNFYFYEQKLFYQKFKVKSKIEKLKTCEYLTMCQLTTLLCLFESC